jgi:hypothetical protein
VIAVTRGVGAVLIVVGVLAYAVSGAESPTALLPAVLGVLVLALGVLAGKEQFHRHAIHAALAVSLLGFLGTVPRALPLLTGGDVDLPVAAWASLATAVVTLAHVGLGVRSFVAARRARTSSAT